MRPWLIFTPFCPPVAWRRSLKEEPILVVTPPAVRDREPEVALYFTVTALPEARVFSVWPLTV